jgi:hypothetical protein
MKREVSIGILVIACALRVTGADKPTVITIPVFVPELLLPRIEVKSSQFILPP